MAWLRIILRRRLSPMQTLGAVAIVGLLIVAAYLTYNFVAGLILQAHIKAALPSVCASIRQQRATIINALEAYKIQFGDYPADHVVSTKPLTVDPVTNTLMYELCGTLYDPVHRRLQVAGLEPADETYVTNFFQCGRFKNCSEKPDQLKTFLSKEQASGRQLHDDPDVFVLGFDASSLSISSDLFWDITSQVSSWRYVRSGATSNPDKFDLWIEIKQQNRTITIGNWKAVE